MIRLTAVIELEGQTRALAHESNARSIILGRDAAADFQIPLTTISRQHAKISETDAVYVIQDLGSTHGTMVNGHKLSKGEKKVLRDGDVIELTKAKITANIEHEKVAMATPGEGTQAIAAKAVQGILGRLNDGQSEGPYLRCISGADEGTRFPLTGAFTEWAMGRSKDCEIVLNDPNVSRRHASVRKDWNGYLIGDLGSKNGVLVNARKIGKPRRLKDQDEITVGPVKLIFIDPDAELMAALSDVPGFEVDEPEEPDVMESDPSVMGAPEAEGSDAGDEPLGDIPPPDEDAETEMEMDNAALDDEDDDYENIDPELLESADSKIPLEMIIIGVVSVLILSGVVLLVLIL